MQQQTPLYKYHLSDLGIVHGGGAPWDPKNTFPSEFCEKYHTLYIYTLIIFQEKKIPPKKKFRFKMVASGLIRFASFQFLQKYEKPFSQKNLFNETWVILGDYEYINIAVIKIVKFVCLFFPMGF